MILVYTKFARSVREKYTVVMIRSWTAADKIRLVFQDSGVHCLFDGHDSSFLEV